MPIPQRAPAPPSPPARKLTPVPPAARRLTPVPPPLPRSAPPQPPAPPLAVARTELERSLDRAFDQILVPGPPRAVPMPATAADLAALHDTYVDLAVEYCVPVRNVMLEVSWGEPPVLWLEQVRSAIAALRAMSEKVELDALATALEGFNGAVGAVVASGEATVSAQRREQLLAAYAPVVSALPRAFDLEGERDRREPIILRSLLLQVPELSPLAVEKFFAAGLVRLAAIAGATAEEIAVVTGVDPVLAGRVLELVRSERALAADVEQERRHLEALTARLGEEHRGVEAAAAGWSTQNQAEKRRWRRQREQSWLRIKISLARLGEVDRIERLERLPFAHKLEALDSFLRAERRPTTRTGGRPNG